MKLANCKRSKFRVTGSALKLFVDKSESVTVEVADPIQTSSAEFCDSGGP